MKQNFKLSDIRKALDAFEQNYPERKTVNFTELEKITKKLSKPLIYNINELTRLLSDYIADNQIQSVQLHKESDVCKILKVKKLAMHHWRIKGYISFVQYNSRTIRYDLNVLLEDLKSVQVKNISLDLQ
jgi:hypothetical protein